MLASTAWRGQDQPRYLLGLTLRGGERCGNRRSAGESRAPQLARDSPTGSLNQTSRRFLDGPLVGPRNHRVGSSFADRANDFVKRGCLGERSLRLSERIIERTRVACQRR